MKRSVNGAAKRRATRAISTALHAVVGFAILAMLVTQTASAAGIGAYFEYGHGEGSLEDAVDFAEDAWGVGLALDSNLARDELVNVRGTIGYRRTDVDLVSINGDGVAITGTLGFGLIRESLFRVWLGPALRLSYDRYEELGLKVDVARIGGGGQLGINLNVGDHFTVGLSGGYQFMGVIAEANFTSFDAKGYEHRVFANATLFYRTDGDIFD